jgi:c(7)-type cytochrome triheme protein
MSKNVTNHTGVTSVLFLTGLVLIANSLFSHSLFAAEDPNKFHRLFVPPDERIQPLKSDGIHDPGSPGLKILQQPKDAFKPLEKSTSGDYVNWVKSLNKGIIDPRFDYLDPKKKALPVDMKIVMQVKGSMPDVVFPHKIHTEWLDCTNCHPAIFTPKKGANPMSMAEIMLGQKCGVCHGSVAFPVTECRRCHSQTGKKGTTKKQAAKK